LSELIKGAVEHGPLRLLLASHIYRLVLYKIVWRKSEIKSEPNLLSHLKLLGCVCCPIAPAEVLVGFKEDCYTLDQGLDVAERLYDQAKGRGMWPDEPLMMTMARVHAIRGDFDKVRRRLAFPGYISHTLRVYIGPLSKDETATCCPSLSVFVLDYQ
jgi:hypothetical protein